MPRATKERSLSFHEKVHRALYETDYRSFFITNDALAILTIVSVVALILDTVPAFADYNHIFTTIEFSSVAVFTIEYLARIIAAKGNRLGYIFSFFGLIDLLSIVPTYLGFTNFTFLKTARILRILRLLRMTHIVKISHIQHIKETDASHHRTLYGQAMLIYFSAVLSSIIIFGTLLYITESGQAAAATIPLGMVWAAKTIMGGLSQHMPATVNGDLVVIVARFTGLALFGLLISLLGDSMKKLLFGDPQIESPIIQKPKPAKKKKVTRRHQVKKE